MSLTEDNYDNLKEMIYSRYEANPNMETLADLEYIVNEHFLDSSIDFTQCQRLRDIIDEMRRPSNHAKTTKGAKKKVKELNKQLSTSLLLEKENNKRKKEEAWIEKAKIALSKVGKNK